MARSLPTGDLGAKVGRYAQIGLWAILFWVVFYLKTISTTDDEIPR
jgi:hypothetical protein